MTYNYALLHYALYIHTSTGRKHPASDTCTAKDLISKQPRPAIHNEGDQGY